MSNLVSATGAAVSSGAVAVTAISALGSYRALRKTHRLVDTDEMIPLTITVPPALATRAIARALAEYVAKHSAAKGVLAVAGGKASKSTTLPKIDLVSVDLCRLPEASVSEFHAAVQILMAEAPQYLRSLEHHRSMWIESRRRRREAGASRTALKIAGMLAALAGPDQEAWTQEWPAHLADIERTWRRPIQIIYYTAGFAVAATKWRLSALLERPAAMAGRVVDALLGSDVFCGLAVVAAVTVATRLTEVHSGNAAAMVVAISSTAASLTAVNQARKMRGIKKKGKGEPPSEQSPSERT